MSNTTRLSRHLSGAWGVSPAIYKHASGSWVAVSKVWRNISGTWVGMYSVLSASGNASLSAAGSGLSSSGTSTTSGAGVSASGNIGTLSYSWASHSGDGSITCSNSAIANPTFSRAISGVANGTTSSAITGTWRCTTTDGDTGANTTFDTSLSFTWQNTIPAEDTLTVTASDADGHVDTFDESLHTVSAGTTATPAGGSGVYSTYAWTYVSGDTVSIDNAAIQSPTFSASMAASSGSTTSANAVWSVLVTDSESHTASTNINVVLTITNIS